MDEDLEARNSQIEDQPSVLKVVKRILLSIKGGSGCQKLVRYKFEIRQKERATFPYLYNVLIEVT